MVRDIESLIEFLYLKSINSNLAEDENVIVNPTESDSVISRTCIINKSYAVPDLSYANKVIDRNVQEYNYTNNPLIESIAIEDAELFIVAIRNKVYFGHIPDTLNISGPCMNYLKYQLSKKSPVDKLDSFGFLSIAE